MHAQIILWNFMHRIAADTNDVINFPGHQTTIFHYQNPYFLDNVCIAACWWPSRTVIDFRWRTVVFELVVLFDFGKPRHRCPLNLENCFRLGISKLVAKLYVMSLFHVLGGMKWKFDDTTSHTGYLPAINKHDDRMKIHVCVLDFPQYCHPIVLLLSTGKFKIGFLYFFYNYIFNARFRFS